MSYKKIYLSTWNFSVLIFPWFSDRRNPFRMLSNAIDFRNRRKVHRPKSADCERGSSSISEHPAGGNRIKCYCGGYSFTASFFYFPTFLFNLMHFNQFLTNHIISWTTYSVLLMETPINRLASVRLWSFFNSKSQIVRLLARKKST